MTEFNILEFASKFGVFNLKDAIQLILDLMAPPPAPPPPVEEEEEPDVSALPAAALGRNPTFGFGPPTAKAPHGVTFTFGRALANNSPYTGRVDDVVDGKGSSMATGLAPTTDMDPTTSINPGSIGTGTTGSGTAGPAPGVGANAPDAGTQGP